MQLYDTFIMPGAPQRHKLTSFVVGKAALDKGSFASLSPQDATLLVTRRCGCRGFSLYLDVHVEASVCISTCLRIQASVCILMGLGFLYEAYRCFYLCVFVCLDHGEDATLHMQIDHGEDATLHMQIDHCGHATLHMQIDHGGHATLYMQLLVHAHTRHLAKCCTCILLIGRGRG